MHFNLFTFRCTPSQNRVFFFFSAHSSTRANKHYTAQFRPHFPVFTEPLRLRLVTTH
jgi:hypothetical protein